MNTPVLPLEQQAIYTANALRKFAKAHPYSQAVAMLIDHARDLEQAVQRHGRVKTTAVGFCARDYGMLCAAGEGKQ